MVRGIPQPEQGRLSVLRVTGVRNSCQVDTLDNGVRRVALDRPSKHNALDWHLADALVREVAGAAKDDAVRCLLITGEGPSFCSGDDLAWRGAAGGASPVRPAVDPATGEALYLRVCAAMAGMPKPVVAAARGAVLGAGLEIFSAADVRLCDSSAVMGNPLLAIGQAGGLAMLGRVVGVALAEELYFTGRQLSSAEAEISGLVSQVTDPQDLDATASAVTARLAGRRVEAVGELKALREGLAPRPTEVLLRRQGQAHRALLDHDVTAVEAAAGGRPR